MNTEPITKESLSQLIIQFLQYVDAKLGKNNTDPPITRIPVRYFRIFIYIKLIIYKSNVALSILIIMVTLNQKLLFVCARLKIKIALLLVTFMTIDGLQKNVKMLNS